MQQGSWSKDMQQEEHEGPRTLMCLFEALRRGKPKCMQKPLKIQQKTRYYLCNSWFKLVGSRVESKGEMIWLVRE